MEKEDIKKILQRKYDFIYPDWWECQWRRNACGCPECPLCGRMMKQRFKYQFKDENPDSKEAFVQDIKDSFEETIFLLDEIAQKEGIDLNNLKEDIEMPPEPGEFPEQKKTHDWILKMHRFAKEKGNDWIDIEAGRDMMWYANLIPAKVYRNLCNRWRLEKGQTDGKIDYDYTHYVLENCIQIIKESFEAVISMNLSQKNELICLYYQFLDFEKEILSI